MFKPFAFLLFAAVVAPICSCLPGEDAQPAESGTSASESSGHHHEAPHGGTLVELGDHVASIEFVYERETGMLTAYVLDAHAENPVRLTGGALFVEVELDGNEEYIPLELRGIANSLTGESETNTSQFGGTDPRMRGQESFGVTVPAVSVFGQQFDDVSARIL